MPHLLLAHSPTPKLLCPRKKRDSSKATHETTNNHRLLKTSLHHYSHAKHLLPPRRFRDPAFRHWPQSPRTTHQVPHPHLHYPRTSSSNPRAVIPHPASQRHILILESADPAVSSVCSIPSPWIASSLISSQDTRSSVVRLQPFFESVLFQRKITLRLPAWSVFGRLHCNTSVLPNFQESEHAAG